ncbi:hypothetical protein AOLI_G00022830 [Acnodon oligacanthus]
MTLLRPFCWSFRLAFQELPPIPSPPPEIERICTQNLPAPTPASTPDKNELFQLGVLQTQRIRLKPGLVGVFSFFPRPGRPVIPLCVLLHAIRDGQNVCGVNIWAVANGRPRMLLETPQ